MAVVVAKADVVLIAPELGDTALSDDQWTAIISDAALEVPSGAFGGDAQATRALKYLVAHLATMILRKGGAQGPVRRESVGSVSREYAILGVLPQGDIPDSLTLTSYGLEYLRLTRKLAVAMSVL